MSPRPAAITRLLLTVILTLLFLTLLPLLLTPQQVVVATSADVSDRWNEAALGTVPPGRPTGGRALTLTQLLLAKLHPTLARQWLTHSNEPLPVLIQLRTQADLYRPAIVAAPSLIEQRAELVHELQTTAERSQASLLSMLAEAQRTAQASGIRSLWINDSIAAQVDRDLLLQIAARDDVAFIQPDRYRRWVISDFSPDSNLQSPTSTEWHIQRIRADQVWSALNVTGTGVVVANMDTGVDWQHPALNKSYRGYNPKGLPDHIFSWFDATNEQAQYPYDGYGHGTHTMGTLVGAGGIGVAPGAQWIAARIFDSQGYAFDSWIHAGLQWILAPGGDPAQAPDVLSNSWGSTNGYDQSFRDDVRALNAAGIDTYFSNGNAGPSVSSVGSPASYLESFGVGAVDDTDWIAEFSGRGPSPFGSLKPDVSAPGVSILSSVPGGGYRKASGTSMAAPQAAGIAALMRSAVPGLTITQTRYALTTTAAHPIVIGYPNNDFGWGRVDALNALMSVLHTGSISGVVRSEAGSPIPAVFITANSRLGTSSSAMTDEAGRYTIYGAASLYTLTASAFGYRPLTITAVTLIADRITQRDISLTPLPTGWVTGRVTDITGTRSLTASLIVQNASMTVTVHGVYTWALPSGTHTLSVQVKNHRIVTATVTITAGQTVTRNFALPAAPSILLVDSGRWYNDSRVTYYRQALNDLGYLYDEWPIRDFRIDLPTTLTLRSFNTVIWSSPLDSPGVTGAGYAVNDYLKAGGHLFLSGQDVGFYDDWWNYEPYYHNQLQAELVADAAASRQLTGTHTFAGMTLHISGAGGADNQTYPDVIRSRAPQLTAPAFIYAPDEGGGQTAGLCQPFRAVYFPFGFEAINDRAVRAEVISRTFGFFNRPAVRNAFAFDQTPEQLIAPPGSHVTGTMTLTNYDEVSPVTLTLAAQGVWNVTVTPASVALKSCESQSITIATHIPLNAGRDVSQLVTITASLSGTPVITTVLRAKAPASVLLVQDDRWYPVDASYRSALAANGVSFDLWRVPTNWPGSEPATPSVERLSWYPQVIWFTGYDWYQPLTLSNTVDLLEYLRQGGRLFLSSQEVLSVAGLTDFTRQTLGVMQAAEDLTASQVSGVQGGLFDGLLQQALNYPYRNYSDAVVPQPDTEIALVGDHGWPVALLHDLGISKTVFMAFGFEGLPPAVQPEVMNGVVGYLSRLGRSNVTTDRAVQPGEVITTSIVILNDGPSAIHRAAFTLTVPAALTYLGGEGMTWSGSLAAGQRVTRTLVLQVSHALSAGSIVTLPVAFRDDDQAIQFTRAARLSVDGTWLSLSYAPRVTRTHPNQVVTWTFTARNGGQLTAPITAVVNLPLGQTWINGSLNWNTGLLINSGDHLGWLGMLGAGEALTISYRLTTPQTVTPLMLYGSAVARTDQTLWQAGSSMPITPYRAYLPIIRKLT